jgi:signal transduction histidine kinase
MYEPQLIEGINLSERQNGYHRQVKRVVLPLESATAETEALLSVIDASVQELSQPMTAVLCWSNLLLSEADPGSPLATDLVIIVEQVKHMSEIIKGLNLLTHYKTMS